MNGLLLVNAGSSSIKFSVFGVALDPICRGQIEKIATAPTFSARDGRGVAIETGRQLVDTLAGHEAGFEFLLNWIGAKISAVRLLAAGHRVVHGGRDFAAPVRIDNPVIAALEALVPLAPLHQPHNLAGIKALRRLDPNLPQIACFDTAFHRTMPEVARRFALPEEFHEAGVERYGFHGLSYEHIARILPQHAPELADARVVVAHLGNGASLCAMRGGVSVDTTMGFTALDGLVMGTRCGAIDPGVLLYLMSERGMTADAIADLLYHRSGLLGVSGIGNDMRTLLESRDPRAARAVDIFVFRLVKELAAMAASLGGLDAIVFTGGIGEHAAAIRARVCAEADWLGIAIDEDANAKGERRISTSRSKVSVWVLPTDEELVMARHTLAVISPSPTAGTRLSGVTPSSRRRRRGPTAR